MRHLDCYRPGVRSSLRFLPFVLVACSSPSAAPPVSTDASVDTADSATDDCHRFAAASCDYGFRCGWFFRAKYSGPGSCIVDLTAKCRESLALPGLVDANNHEPCATALFAASCETTVAECKSRAGTLPNNEPCRVADQCASAYCQLDESSCGTCKTPPVEGAACDSSFECADAKGELTCDLTARRCVKRAQLGDACEIRGCAVGLSCVEKICVRSAAAGEACTGPSNPTAPQCVDGLACADTCKPYQVVNVGESCDPARQCHGDARCISGTCAATKAIGEACTSLGDCPWWATCSAGKCVEGFTACSR